MRVTDMTPGTVFNAEGVYWMKLDTGDSVALRTGYVGTMLCDYPVVEHRFEPLKSSGLKLFNDFSSGTCFGDAILKTSNGAVYLKIGKYVATWSNCHCSVDSYKVVVC